MTPLRTATVCAITGAALAIGCGNTQTHTVTAIVPPQSPTPPPIVKPPVHVTRPPSHDPESQADGQVTAGGAACGRERWDVKTLTDPHAQTVTGPIVDATIADLDQLPATNPANNPDQPRDGKVERTIYRVHATLDAVKQEADSDYHLALSDGQGHSMIAEIPDAPACTQPPVTARVATLEQSMVMARDAFVAAFGQPTSQAFERIGKPVVVTGVGFFDKLHGQRNVAPNGIELHPVIAITADP